MQKVVHPETVEVVHEPGSGAVIQMIFEAGPNHDMRDFCIFLSPPDAKRIARELQKTVKSYLNDIEEVK